jgi:hypothetical protein
MRPSAGHQVRLMHQLLAAHHQHNQRVRRGCRCAAVHVAYIAAAAGGGSRATSVAAAPDTTATASPVQRQAQAHARQRKARLLLRTRAHGTDVAGAVVRCGWHDGQRREAGWPLLWVCSGAGGAHQRRVEVEGARSGRANKWAPAERGDRCRAQVGGGDTRAGRRGLEVGVWCVHNKRHSFVR